MLLAKNILQCNCLLVVQTLSLIVFLLFISGCSSENEGNSSLPNVVVILTDDQGWGDLSLTGNTNFSTPNIDRLAREGALLENFYVSPVCSPTRAEFLTGRYHTRSGVYSTSRGGEMIDLDEELIAEIFKRAGYKTAAYGKWHNGTQAPYHPNSRGFDDFYGFCSGHWGSYFDPMLEHNGELTKGNGYLSDDLTDKGINFINNNKDQAFFLYLPYNTPHSPMQVPQNLWDKYKDKELVLRYSDPAKENLDETRAALAMCENIDWNIGRIRESLEENGLLNNTIIVFFSDNGPAGWRWNNGFKGKKGSVDEGGVRSPGIVNWPDKISAGTVVNAQVSAIDLLPTLVSLTDIDHTPKNPLDGKDFSELLFQRISEGWHDRLIVSYWNQSLSLRNSQFRLDEEGKLYDMISDPGQTQNVASKYKQMYDSLQNQKEFWLNEFVRDMENRRERLFPVGHPSMHFTQLPARDANATGNITRSNRWPNCSFFTNWVSSEDSIYWNVEVIEAGKYEVEIYYTAPPSSIGTEIILSSNGNMVSSTIDNAFQSELSGMKYDRIPRKESYVKKFTSKNLGIIELDGESTQLTLKANNMTGKKVMDFRLLFLKKI